ncbi:MAG TPA: hypothetical protein VF131_11085 [Blastocatellia bacterium]|nr:hypothetical protein [Blastocatellia bacterium]
MTSLTKFDTEIYSEEIYGITEAEYDEVMAASALDDGWQGSKEINGILIKKACEHTHCPHTRCQREVRLGGIAI